MEAEIVNFHKDEVSSTCNLVPKAELLPFEMLKTELIDEMYGEYDVKPTLIQVKSEAENGYFLNSSGLEAHKLQSQVYDTNIQTIVPYHTVSNEEDIRQRNATYHQLKKYQQNVPKPALLCSVCGYRTFHAGHMRVHIVRHKTFKPPKPPKVFKCENCEYQTKSKWNLKLHSGRHERAQKWIYDELPGINKIIENLNSSRHIFGKKKPEEALLLQCPDCDYKTQKRGHFRLHVQRHKAKEAEPRVLMCEVCGYQTKRKSTLYIHMRRHKEKKEANPSEDPKFDHHDHFLFQESYKCKICDFFASNKRQLYRHNAKHKRPEERRTIKRGIMNCSFCDYQSTSNYLFNNHLKSHSFIVTENDTFKCSLCDFQTIRNVTLKVHMAREHDSSEVTRNKCEHCSYESLHKNDFKKHLLTHKPPEELKMWKCLECDFETLHKSNLNTHVIRRHRKDDELEIFQCYNCGYESRFKSRLKEHMVIHRRPNVQEMHKCEDCDYETMRRKNFMRHMRLRHKTKKISRVENYY